MHLITAINLLWSWQMHKRHAGFPLRHLLEQQRVEDTRLRHFLVADHLANRLPLAVPPGGPCCQSLALVIHRKRNWGRFPGTQLQQNKGQSGSVTLPP